MNRFAARSVPDKNQAEVISWYEELYCSVVDLHGIGFGCPDLMIGLSGRTELVEVKTEVGHAEATQVRFNRDWRGSKVKTVTTHADVIAHVQDVRERVSRGRK